jgi:APA family basic amino acid/polyamine antiporter
MINMGSMIGSGIFLVPAMIALYVQSSWMVTFVWIVGGVVSLFGALSVAELGAMYPKAGGLYVYLHEAYGPLWGFLYGWTAFTVIMTAAISAVAVGFATYLGYFVPLTDAGIKIVAIASIAILTAVNCLGVKLGALVQNSFTFVKIGLLGALVVLAFFSGNGSTANLTSMGTMPSFLGMVGPFGLALVAVLWSYDGWIEITFVAGEVKNPQRNIPRALIISTVLVILVYVMVNLAYMWLLPFETISHSTMVAADAATAVIGPRGAMLAAIGVMIAMIGSNNGFILTGARIYYAMAKQNSFITLMAKVHPRFHTPIPSLVGQGIWAGVLVLTGTFDQLITYVIFASWIFYAMAAAGVLVLRKKSPEHPRPYKTWGYPFTPIVFVLFSFYIVINTLVEDPRDAAFGLAIILLGLPAYYYWIKKKRH